MTKYRAAMWKQDNWFVAQCIDADVATQGGSEAETAHNMQEALALHFEVPEVEVEVEFGWQWESSPPSGEQAERTFRHVRSILESHGFHGITQRPFHAKFIRDSDTAILPHYTDLAHPVIASILRQAKLPIDVI